MGTPVTVPREALPAFLERPVITSMNFLNEVANRYPDAISFAPGRPNERFLADVDVARHLDSYTGYLRDELGLGEAAVRRTLLQYGPAAGIITELTAGMLRRDEGIDVPPGAVVMTVGCQEAMFIALRALCPAAEDVALVADPGYLGLVGAAHVLGVSLVAVPEGRDGLDPDSLTRAIGDARAAGRRPRVLYVIPDFANPSGQVMSLERRRELLALAERENILLLEDNPYGFTAGDRQLPTLKALDDRGRVVYLGTFAKVCLPGTRVGYVVADQLVTGDGVEPHFLAEELATIKSMVTLNTSPIDQAIIGGILVENGGTLAPLIGPRSAFYRDNLRVLMECLGREFGAGLVSWNDPPGGFFAVLTVPFVADAEALTVSAEKHGVLWTPMSYFFQRGGHHQLRLSVSYLEPDVIAEGVRRLAGFVAEQAVSREGPRR
jgi:(S)-3,5-dihydroxyphenylglycine transaminase